MEFVRRWVNPSELKAVNRVVVRGEISFPGDKSISHRALMLGALSAGECEIENISTGLDVESTRMCLRSCGISSTKTENTVIINGGTLTDPAETLNCGNSGTSARLLLGLLSGQGISATMIGDKSLTSRPMQRVITPLVEMGAKIESSDYHLPVILSKDSLTGIKYMVPVASAQVKSAILLAGLGAEGPTTVIERANTRNHTEIMLQNLGADVDLRGKRITVSKLEQPLATFRTAIPGDPSTAAFIIAAGALLPGSELILKNVLVNPTRTGFFMTLENMGVQIEIIKQWDENGESVGDLLFSSRPLQSVFIATEMIPLLIDEIPILAVLATQAAGTTVVTGAAELRVKETDRIHAIYVNLKRMGADIAEFPSGFRIKGPTPLKGSRITTYGDHRIAMAFTIAGLIADGPVHLDNSKCIDISCPEFNQLLKTVII